MKKKLPLPTHTEKPAFLFHVLIFFGIVFLGGLIYSNTLHSEFLFDDLRELSENFALRHFPDIAAIWHISRWRFLTYLSFGANYYFGHLEVTGYHAVNLVLHIFNSLLVYVFICFLFKSPRLRQYSSAENGRWTALFSSFIFLTHPLQTAAVTYVIQRTASLAAFFYFSALVSYIAWRLHEKKLFFMLTLGACVAAMFTKQNALTLPGALLMTEMIFWGWNENEGSEKKIFRLLPFFLCSGIILMIQLAPALGKPGGALLPADSVLISRGDYLLTQCNVLRTYLRLLFIPLGQNLDYDYPISHHFFENGTWISFGMLAALFSFALFLLKRERLISFGILWFFLTLCVESGLVPIRDVIFEHRLYLPLFGFALAISAAFQRWGKDRRICISFFLVLILTFSWLTYQRNETWKTGIRLWQDVIRKSPRKWRPYHNLAFHYNAAGNYVKAVEFAGKAIALDSSRSGPYVTLAIAYDRMGQFDKAMEAYGQASQRVLEDPAKFYNDLGSAYARHGNLAEGIKNFEKAVKANPEFPPSYGNLGFAYDQKGDYDTAISFYLKGIALDPHFAEAYNQLGIAYGKKGSPDQAIAYAQKAVEINPHFADAYNTLGVSYGMKKDYERMIFYLRRAISEEPRFARAYGNLANAYAAKGDRLSAQAYAQKAAELTPQGAVSKV